MLGQPLRVSRLIHLGSRLGFRKLWNFFDIHASAHHLMKFPSEYLRILTRSLHKIETSKMRCSFIKRLPSPPLPPPFHSLIQSFSVEIKLMALNQHQRWFRSRSREDLLCFSGLCYERSKLVKSPAAGFGASAFQPLETPQFIGLFLGVISEQWPWAFPLSGYQFRFRQLYLITFGWNFVQTFFIIGSFHRLIDLVYKFDGYQSYCEF